MRESVGVSGIRDRDPLIGGVDIVDFVVCSITGH